MMFFIAASKDFREQLLASRFELSRLIFHYSDQTLARLDSERK